MNAKQALTKARRLFGKTAAVRIQPRGGFIGEDGIWRDSTWLCDEDGKRSANKPRDFYIIARKPALVLGRKVAEAPCCVIGKIVSVGGVVFFEVRAEGPDFAAAFKEYERREEAKNEEARKKS